MSCFDRLARYAHPCTETGKPFLRRVRQERISIHDSKALLPGEGFQCAGVRYPFPLALPVARVFPRRSGAMHVGTQSFFQRFIAQLIEQTLI